MAATMKPVISGARLDCTAWLRRSMMATTNITRSAVPTIWSISGPQIPPWKYAAGKVAKMENEAFVCPFTFGPGAAASYAPIAWW